MIPAPRDDLEVTGDSAARDIEDPVTGHRTRLGPQGAAVWGALSEGADDVEALEAATGLDPGTLAWRLRQIDCALVLDSPRWRAQRALFGPRPDRAERPPLRMAPELRHRCVGCGSSCHAVHVGPVPLATHLAADHHGLWRDVPGASSAGDLFVQVGEQRFMARRDDACVVLRPDGRCAVHAAAGAAAKPGVCRQFPYTLTRTADAIHVGLQMECRSLAESLASGRGDAGVDADLAALVGEDAQIYDLPVAVPLAPGIFVDAGELLAWLRPVADRITAAAGLPWGALMDDVCAEALPFVAARARLVDDAWCPDVDVPAPAAAADLLRGALTDGLEALVDAASGAGKPFDAALARHVLSALPAAFGEALPTVSWHPDAVTLLHTAVAADLQGLEVVRDRDLLFGLGRLRLTLTLAETVARRRALTVARRVVRAQDINDAIVAVTRALRTTPLVAALRAHAAEVRWLGAAAGRPFEVWMGAPG